MSRHAMRGSESAPIDATGSSPVAPIRELSGSQPDQNENPAASGVTAAGSSDPALAGTLRRQPGGEGGAFIDLLEAQASAAENHAKALRAAARFMRGGGE